MSITLSGLRFHAKHGALPQERIVGGDYEVELTLHLAECPAMQTDKLDDTVNYAEAYELVKHEMEQPSDLIEHVAARIAGSILEHLEKVEAADVTVKKLNPPIGAPCHAAIVKAHFTR